MIQNSTKYNNPQRTITGLVNQVTNADTIILCDTSSGAVSLELLKIPNDQWNTSYKLYIVDKSNNAGTNNITVNAPVGFTINNQPSLVISTNGVGVVVTISSNTGYLGNLTTNNAGGGSVTVINQQNPLTPPATLTTTLDKLTVNGFQTLVSGNNVTLQNDFVTVLFAQLQYLIANSLLIPNQQYNVTNAIFGNSIIGHSVYIKALTNNSVDNYGTGKFYNADYGNIGNYTGVSGYAGQLGVWLPTLVVVIGNVVIWNNFHYVTTTGVNTATPPDADPINWTLLSYSDDNGYIVEYDKITYYSDLNQISSREDRLLNYVEFYIEKSSGNNLCSLNRFQWGNTFCNQNKVIGNSFFDNCNVIFKNRMSNNHIENVELFLCDFTQPSQFNKFQNNQFITMVRALKIYGFALDIDFSENHFYETIGIPVLNLKSGVDFRNNTFDSVSLNCTLENCNFFKNKLINTNLQIGSKTHGFFNENYLVQSNVNITFSEGIEVANTILNGTITLGTQKGRFATNTIQNASFVDIVTIDTNGIFEYNYLDNGSYIQVTTQLSGSIGNGGVKGNFNKLSNNSKMIFDTVSAGDSIYATNLDISSVIQIDTFDGAISLCNLSNSGVRLKQMAGKTLVGLDLFSASLGSPTYVLPQTFNTGQFITGIGTIKADLDCSDPAIFNAGTNTLTIPAELSDFAGKFVLLNAGAIQINKILGLNQFLLQAVFTNDAGSTKFQTSAIAGAISGDIVWNVPAPTLLTINFRLGKTDYIAFKPSGSVNAITEVGIFL